MHKRNRLPFWIRTVVLEDDGGGSDKPDADKLEKIVEGNNDDSDSDSDSDSGSEGDADGGTEEEEDKGEEEGWDEVFPDQTPQQVKESLDEWKKNSRSWEKKSKDNYAELKKLRDKSGAESDAETAELRGELGFYQDIITYAIANGGAENIPELVDSLSLRRAHEQLDREDEDFEKSLGEIIQQRVGAPKETTEEKKLHRGPAESYQDHSKAVGDQLYDSLYGDKK